MRCGRYMSTWAVRRLGENPAKENLREEVPQRRNKR